MRVLQAGVKVAAVLGLAFVTVLLTAATLYLLVSAPLIQDQPANARGDTNGLASSMVESEAAARSEQASSPSSRTLEPDRSETVSESRIRRPESTNSEIKTSTLTPDPSETSPSGLGHDSKPEAEASPLLGSASAPELTQVSPPPSNTSSEATADTSPSSPTVDVPAEARDYTVAEGDTLYSIARQVYGAGKYWRAIYDANRDLIEDPVKLKLMWRLELPPPEKVIPEN